eukprot:4488492-Amphidinium_carterae.1
MQEFNREDYKNTGALHDITTTGYGCLDITWHSTSELHGEMPGKSYGQPTWTIQLPHRSTIRHQ